MLAFQQEPAPVLEPGQLPVVVLVLAFQQVPARVPAFQQGLVPAWRRPRDSSAPVQKKQSMPAVSAPAC